MKKLSFDASGFTFATILAALLVVGFIGVIGWYVYEKDTPKATNQNSVNRPENAKPLDRYEGWKTYASKREGLSFKYPADWDGEAYGCVNHLTQAGAECFRVKSPKRDNSTYTFSIVYQFNRPTQGPLGRPIDTISLTVPQAEKNFSLVGAPVGTGHPEDENKIGQYILVDQKDTTTILKDVASSNSERDMNFLMAASMGRPGDQYNPGYTLEEYKKHPDYETVVKIFQSLSYE